MKKTIFDKFYIDANEARKSSSWYASQVAAMQKGGVSPHKVITGLKHTDARIQPGSLYFFYYDPKLKATLPFYDRFPMVFPFRSLPDGFLGLNLHYLNYAERFALFRRLMSIHVGPLDATSKIKFSWATVNAFAQVDSVGACVKRYLSNHVKSPLMRVEPKDWGTSMLLPVERFEGADKEHVWRVSRNKNGR